MVSAHESWDGCTPCIAIVIFNFTTFLSLLSESSEAGVTEHQLFVAPARWG